MQDQVMPSGKWEFDGEVASVFDDMLSRSIPQYDVMRRACFDIACKYIHPNTDILDLGCSRGESLAFLVDRFGSDNRYIGIDVSQPMIDAARDRFKMEVERGVVKIDNFDLRAGFPPVLASVTLCVLTLQFTPIEYRLRIMQDIYDHIMPGGALILVEKVIGGSAKLNASMVDIYYDLKSRNGYSQEQIERKRLSLEGVLVPMTAKWNEEMMSIVGFRQIDCFWRWMNFAGWVAIK